MRFFSGSAVLGALILPWQTHASSTGHETSGGSVATYDLTNCAEFLSGAEVYIYPGLSLDEQEATVVAPFELLAGAGAVVGSAKCTLHWKKLFCFSALPPAFQAPGGEWLPKPLCKSACDEVHSGDFCQAGFATVTAAGYGPMIMQCDDKLGDDALASYMYPNYLSELQGEAQFPAAHLTVPSLGNLEVPCHTGESSGPLTCQRKQCVHPYVEVSRSAVGDDHSACRNYSTSEVDCDACSSNCEVICPLPVYEESMFSWMWAARWLPALMALPLNMLVARSEASTLLSKDKKKRKFANTWVLVTAVLGICYTMLDAVPSLFLKNDLGCGSEDTYTEVGANNTLGHTSCAVLQYNVHILQMMFASVGVTLQQLYMKLSSAAKMKSYAQPLYSKVWCCIWVFLIPFCIFLVHVVAESANGQPNTKRADGTMDMRDLSQANYLRYAHSCGPRLATIDQEWIIVLGPFLLFGAVLCICSFMLLRVVLGLIVKSSSSKEKTAANKTQINLAKTMVKFAFFCVILVFVNIGTLVPFLSQALDFASELNFWQQCAVTGVNVKNCTADSIADCPGGIEADIGNSTKTLLRCGAFDEVAPGPLFVLMINFTYSMPPAIFGFLFGNNLLKKWLSEKKQRYIKPQSDIPTKH